MKLLFDHNLSPQLPRHLVRVRELLARHVDDITEFELDEAAALLLITLNTVFKVVHPPESS